MLCGSSREKSLVILALSLSLIGGMSVACKKKSKKKGGADTPTEEVKDEKKVKNDEQENQLGREIIEGNSMVFRGQDGVFFIQATPYSVGIGQQVRFDGNCGENNQGQLTWNFGESSSRSNTAQGAQANHSYARAGTFQVIATCLEGAKTQQGTLTITVRSSTGGVISNNPNQGGAYQSGGYYYEEGGCQYASGCGSGQ